MQLVIGRFQSIVMDWVWCIPVSFFLTLSLIGNVCAEDRGYSTKEIPKEFFGLHIHHLDVPYPGNKHSAWPTIQFGAWRLWGSYVEWYELEPSRGKWDFSRLDQYVDLAEKKGVDLMLTLGRPPKWASARPEERCGQGYGCAAEPADINDWANYVRRVASRYKGRISAYEIWNEPAFSEVEITVKNKKPVLFYSGSAAKMVELAKVAYETLKQVDPTITVVSPAFTSEGVGLKRLETYLTLGGGRWADVIGFHYYVTPPEEIGRLTPRLRSVLNNNGLKDIPIWNTEMGYQFAREDLNILPGIPKNDWRDILDPEKGAAYVSRALILSAANSIERVYWFNWDGEPPHPTMGLAESAGHKATLMSAAYQKVFDWLVDSRVRGCKRNSNAVWSCDVDKGSRHAILVWTEKGVDEFIPSSFSAVAFEKIGQDDSKVGRGEAIPIGIMPILIKSEISKWKD